MRGLVFIVVVLLFSGCATERMARRYIEKNPAFLGEYVDTIPEVVHDTITVDVIVPVTIPGDTVRESVRLPGDMRRLPAPVMGETSLAYARAWVEGDSIHLELIQREKVLSIPGQVEVPVTEINNRIIYRPPAEKFIPRWAYFYKHAFFVLIGLILVTIILFVYRLTRLRM